MAGDADPPRMLGPHADADTWTPRERSKTDSPVLDEQPRAKQIDTVVGQRNPHRHREIAGTTAKLVRRPLGTFDRPAPALHLSRAAAAHHLDPLERIEGANEHAADAC